MKDPQSVAHSQALSRKDDLPSSSQLSPKHSLLHSVEAYEILRPNSRLKLVDKTDSAARRQSVRNSQKLSAKPNS